MGLSELDANREKLASKGGRQDDDMITLNEDFLLSLQEALKETPDACLAPIVMEYMEYLMELIVKKNPNLFGDEFRASNSRESAKDFCKVAKFFQSLKSGITPIKTSIQPAVTASTSTSQQSSSSVTNFSSSSSQPLNSAGSGTGFFFGNKAPASVSNSPKAKLQSAPESIGIKEPVAAVSVMGTSNSTPVFVSTPSQPSLSFSAPSISFGTGPITFGTAFKAPAGAGTSTTSIDKPFSSSSAFSSGFSFSSNVNAVPNPMVPSVNGSTAKDNEESDDETPPKPDHKTVVEDDSLFTQRVKLFELEDKKYKDLGIGNLFVKQAGNEKHQLVVRADNSLGTILLNTILNSSMPAKILKPANVLISVPTSEGKGKTYVLRVKTPEMGAELLENLEKYKAKS